MPIKEILKRTHAEAIAKKSQSKETEEPKAKRFKTDTPNDDKLKFVNLPPTKKELRLANKQMSKEPQKPANTSVAADKSNNTVHIISDDSDSGPEEAPSTSQAQTAQSNAKQQQRQSQIGKKKFKNKNIKNRQNRNQSSSKPIDVKNFDYKNVDFRKFQGGAQRAKGMELKPQFHGKVCLENWLQGKVYSLIVFFLFAEQFK